MTSFVGCYSSDVCTVLKWCRCLWISFRRSPCVLCRLLATILRVRCRLVSAARRVRPAVLSWLRTLTMCLLVVRWVSSLAFDMGPARILLVFDRRFRVTLVSLASEASSMKQLQLGWPTAWRVWYRLGLVTLPTT